MNKNDKTKYITWVDGAKFVAIMAVMVDHTFGVLYSNEFIRIVSFFSVSLFVLISGITAWGSSTNVGGLEGFFVSIKKITGAYLLATFIYQIVRERFFDFEVYLNHLKYFNASGPFYYVCLYMQLMIVKQPLKAFFSKSYKSYTFLFNSIGLLVIIVLSYFTMNYTNIFNLYGAGKLFGGTYLVLFFVGMLIAKYNWLDAAKNSRVYASIVVFSIAWIIWIKQHFHEMASLEAFLKGGNLANPPSIVLMVSAGLLLPVLFGVFAIWAKSKIRPVSLCLNGVLYIGRHSLYIFLYHRLVLDYILVPYVQINHIWLKRFVYMGMMISGSLIIEIIIKRIGKLKVFV